MRQKNVWATHCRYHANQPFNLGVFERDIETIATLVHEAGGLLYYDGANLNAILGNYRPGDMGFDVHPIYIKPLPPHTEEADPEPGRSHAMTSLLASYLFLSSPKRRRLLFLRMTIAHTPLVDSLPSWETPVF